MAQQAAQRTLRERLDRVPKLRAVSVADCAGKRRSAVEGAGRGSNRAPQAQSQDPRHGRPGRVRIGVSEGTVGRDETAGGLRARAGGGTGSAVHGRAVLGAGRADGGEPARRTIGAVGGQEDQHAVGVHRHPQHRGGDPAGRPDHRAGQESGAHPDEFQGRAAAAAGPPLAVLHDSGGLRLQDPDQARHGFRRGAGADARDRAAAGTGESQIPDAAARAPRRHRGLPRDPFGPRRACRHLSSG